MPSPQITLGGLSLNSWDADDPAMITETLDGWYSAPPLRAAYTAIPYGPGSFYSPAYTDARTITIAGTIVASTAAKLIQRQRVLGAVCSDPVTLTTLRVDDDAGSLITNVQRSSAVLIKPVHALASAFSLTLTAPDPRLRSVDLLSASTTIAGSGTGGALWNGPDGTSGTQWNGSSPGNTGLAYGVPNSSGVVRCSNYDGTAPADLLLTVEGPCTNPVIHTVQGDIRFNGALGANDDLVIDTGSGSVLFNGANRRNLLTKATWFQIPAGDFLDLQFSEDNTDPTALLTAQWRVSYY